MNTGVETGIEYRPQTDGSVRVLLDGKMTGTIRRRSLGKWSYKPRGNHGEGEAFSTLAECKHSLETDESESPTPAPPSGAGESEHSPLPWLADGVTVYYQNKKQGTEPAVAICGPDSGTPAWIDSEETQQANAQMIVHRVNSFSLLVEALDRLRELTLAHFKDQHDGHGNRELARALDAADNALTAAKGGE